MIDTRMMVFLGAVAVFLAALAMVVIRSYRRAGRSADRDWGLLLGRLEAVNNRSIAEVALDFIDETGQQRRDEGSATLEPERIWKLVGGLEGLKALEANCEVLIDLAFYLQQWYPDALIVTEQLRLSARDIEWHFNRLKSAQKTGKLKGAFAEYAQPAVATYYSMTRRLLDLYEQGNFPMLAELRKAL